MKPLLTLTALLFAACAPTQNCAVLASRVSAFLGPVEAKRIKVIREPGRVDHAVLVWSEAGRSFQYDPRTDRYSLLQ